MSVKPVDTSRAILCVIPDADWDAIVAERKPVSDVVADMDIEVHAGRLRRNEKRGKRTPQSVRYFAKRWGWAVGKVHVHFMLYNCRGLA